MKQRLLLIGLSAVSLPGMVAGQESIGMQAISITTDPAPLEAGDDADERAKYAIENHLTEELDEEFEREKAADIADSIVDQFEDRVDRAYSGWETNKATEQDVEELILDVVALEYNRSDLIDDPFMDAIRNYLVNNYA